MYFNKKTENTNIDKEFDNNSKKKIDFSKFKIPAIILVIVLLIIGIIFIIFRNKKEYFIYLNGEHNIKVYQGSEFVDPGYSATDVDNNDLTDSVVVDDSNVDTQVIGEYEVVYTLNKTIVKRFVSVVEKPTGATYIKLIGNKIIYLEKGVDYQEPGFIAVDTIDGNLTSEVKVTNSIDKNKVGTYKIIYSVTNSSGVTMSAVRNVIIVGSDINLSLNNTNYTNQNVGINVYVNDKYFSYLILPNGNKITDNSYTYNVSENGTYKFVSYNKQGKSKESSVDIKNINKTKPTGSCSGTYGNGKTNITINATDDIGISKYVINGETYTKNEITLNKEVSSVSVTVYDKAGNTENISCSLSKNSSSKSSASSSSNEDKMDGWILIGDSRFVGMESAIGSSKPKNVYIIAKTSMGYDWLVNTAVGQANKILKENPGKKFYIYSNLGINGMSTKYASKLNELALTDWKGHKVGFISVNPYGGSYHEKNASIAEYNKNQKSMLDGVYYCDTYNGIGVGKFGCGTSGCLHYNSDTYKKIYNYIINKCNY